MSPLTDGRPKCLVEFLGVPMLDRAIESLGSAGVQDITVVTGYRADMIEAKGLQTRYNPLFESTNMVHRCSVRKT